MSCITFPCSVLTHAYKTCQLWRTKLFRHQESGSFILPTFPSTYALLSMKEKNEWKRKARNDNSILYTAWDPRSWVYCLFLSFTPISALLPHSRSSCLLTGTESHMRNSLHHLWRHKQVNRPVCPFAPCPSALSFHFIPLVELAPFLSFCFASGFCHFLSLSHLLSFCLPPWQACLFPFHMFSPADSNLNHFKMRT